MTAVESVGDREANPEAALPVEPPECLRPMIHLIHAVAAAHESRPREGQMTKRAVTDG